MATKRTRQRPKGNAPKRDSNHASSLEGFQRTVKSQEEMIDKLRKENAQLAKDLRAAKSKLQGLPPLPKNMELMETPFPIQQPTQQH